MTESIRKHPVVCELRDLGAKWLALAGAAIGGFVSLILILGLPFAIGFCFFIIGSESNPLGPVLFACYLATIALPPIIGAVAGALLHRIVRAL